MSSNRASYNPNEDWEIYSDESLDDVPAQLSALGRLRTFFKIDPTLNEERAVEEVVELVIEYNTKKIREYAEQNSALLLSPEPMQDIEGKGKEKESELESEIQNELEFGINFYYRKAESKELYHCLDEAWNDNNNKSLNEAQRHAAFIFICYVLNVDHTKVEAKEKINELMADRESNKDKLPEYIPGRNVRRAKPSKLGSYPKKEFKKRELLTIDPKKRELDVKDGVPYLDAATRARYNVVISNGLFTQHGKIVNTFSPLMISHRKKGFGAFTLNQFGEINLFPHFQGDLHNVNASTVLLHSSMSLDSEFVCTGELQIINGSLKAITTYSGHYIPSLYNIYRALEYFEGQGVDVSSTAIYLMHDPKDFNMPFASRYKWIPQYEAKLDQDQGDIVLNERKGSSDECLWHAISAADLLNNIKKDLMCSITKLEFSLKNSNFGKEHTKTQSELQELKVKLNEATRFNVVDNIRSEFKLLSKNTPQEALPIGFFNHRSVKNKEIFEKLKTDLNNNIAKLEEEFSIYLKRSRGLYIFKDCILRLLGNGVGLTLSRKKLVMTAQEELNALKTKVAIQDNPIKLNVLCIEFDRLLRDVHAANEKLSQEFKKSANSGALSKHLKITLEKDVLMEDNLTRSKLIF